MPQQLWYRARSVRCIQCITFYHDYQLRSSMFRGALKLARGATVRYSICVLILSAPKRLKQPWRRCGVTSYETICVYPCLCQTICVYPCPCQTICV